MKGILFIIDEDVSSFKKATSFALVDCISAPIYESLPLSLCLLLAVDMPPCSKNQSTASISQSTNKWAPAQASVSSARNAHTGHCFDRSPAVIFMGMIPPCLCVLLWMAPCVTFQSILKGYYVIMSLFHFPEMRENVDLSIYWRKVSVIIFFDIKVFPWKSNKVNLFGISDCEKIFLKL